MRTEFDINHLTRTELNALFMIWHMVILFQSQTQRLFVKKDCPFYCCFVIRLEVPKWTSTNYSRSALAAIPLQD